MKETMVELTIDQAVKNAQVLDHKNVVFTLDKNGNLNYISKFNVLGRFLNFVKNLKESNSEHKVNKVILATFETIDQYAKNHPDKPVWTYHYYDRTGKDYDIGFDKVAMRVLMNGSRFESSYYLSPENQSDGTRIKIRELAYNVLLMATDQRKKEGIKFDSDHIHS